MGGDGAGAGRSGVVVVVGSVNADVVVRVPVLPGAGRTVTGGTASRAPGGKGANQAVAAARRGARVHLVARVGDDDEGRAALADLRAEGVGTAGVLTTAGSATGLAVVLVDDGGENSIAVASGANHALTAADVRAALAALDAPRAVLLAGLEVPLEATVAAARAARSRGWTVVLNPAPAQPLPPALLADVDVLTPNEHELAELSPDGAGPLLAAGAGWVVTTLGAAGARVERRGHPPVHLPATPVAATDTTGAGDTYSGALAAGLAAGDDVLGAARLAGVAAALSTTAPGARAGTPTREALAAHGTRAAATVSDGA